MTWELRQGEQLLENTFVTAATQGTWVDPLSFLKGSLRHASFSFRKRGSPSCRWKKMGYLTKKNAKNVTSNQRFLAPHTHVAALNGFKPQCLASFSQPPSGSQPLFPTTRQFFVLLLILNLPQTKNERFILTVESTPGPSYWIPVCSLMGTWMVSNLPLPQRILSMLQNLNHTTTWARVTGSQQ